MAISIRLDENLERELELAAATKGVSKSTLVRQCLAEYLLRNKPKKAAWELGKELFGQVGSGRSDLSRNRKRIVREKIHAAKGRR
jgi:Ribbon-helix-helix protein, copG family